eukprot:5160148-Amphidinium_carterae.1
MEQPAKRQRVMMREELSADCVREGRVLTELANEVIPRLVDANVAVKRQVKLTYGTMCSGSEIVHHVLEAIQSSFEQLGCSFTFEQKFLCELNTAKRAWSSKVAGPGTCAFIDMQTLGHPTSVCSCHDRRCVVPFVDMLAVGLSCKDLSPAGRRLGQCLTPEALMNSSTARTFFGFFMC